MTVTITCFVHGTTTNNERGIATGQLPGKLSSRGLHEAKGLAGLRKGKTWEQAIAEDWRKQKGWQPGWEYVVED